MSFWSALTGEDSANASKAAAADQYRKQQDATSKLLGYGDQYAASERALSGAYDPYVQAGLGYNQMVQQLVADPSSVRNLPGYQFDQSEGLRALGLAANAKHNLYSGNTSKDTLRFATGLADKTYGDQLARLMGLNQQGLAATGAQTGVIDRGLTGQLGARTSAYNGDMQSAGTIGQGNIAAANAKAQGSQNLLNTGVKIAGMALAPFTGGTSLAASGLLSGLNPFGSASYGGGSIYDGSAYGGSRSNPLAGLSADDYGYGY